MPLLPAIGLGCLILLNALPDDFLKDELRGRLANGPVEFDL